MATLGRGGVTEALNGPYSVTVARELCRVGLAEVHLLFNIQRISLEKFPTGDTLVMLVLEASAALKGSET